MFGTDQGLEARKSGSWKNTEALAPNFTLGAAEKDWAGRSQRWAVTPQFLAKRLSGHWFLVRL